MMFRSPAAGMADRCSPPGKQALSNLNPGDVRESADRSRAVGLVAASHGIAGPDGNVFRASASFRATPRGGGPDARCGAGAGNCDVADLRGLPAAAGSKGFSLDLEAPEDCMRRILRSREDLLLPLARQFYPFRKPAAQHVIRAVAKENALFCLATAIPDVVPFLGWVPWAVGEFGSDAAFLTMNQIRMAFLLAAASDRTPGYREQRSEIASIVAGAFGWRALARELVGKVPFGGGLIPKAGIAWAGTFAVGLSLERLYRLGYGFTRAERRAVYEEAYEHGRQIAGMLLEGLRRKKAV